MKSSAKHIMLLALLICVGCTQKPVDPNAAGLMTLDREEGEYSFECGINTINGQAHSSFRYAANLKPGPTTAEIKCIYQKSGFALFKTKKAAQFQVTFNAEPQKLYQFKAQASETGTSGWVEDISGQSPTKEPVGQRVSNPVPGIEITQ
jgi:hypothetical protein